MIELFNEDEMEFTVEEYDMGYLQESQLFNNSILDIYDDIMCDPADLTTIIVKNDMQFLGRAYIYKISRSPKMIDDNYDKTFYYLSVYGVFDTYIPGEGYKKYYDKKN